MKIMLMTDMEGVAGILNHDDWVMRSGPYYEKGLRLLTGEVNAAVEGFCEGGVTEVVVCDGHGQGGIDPELLHERAQLLRGHGDGGPYPFGLDSTFDGMAWVGQHAKAGTDFSHLTHTGWFSTIDASVNGVSLGEYGEMAMCAKELGVPCFFASGEAALCAEAEALTPGVVTVAVKWGLKRDGLEHLSTEEYRTAKLSARHLAPAEARGRIREGARDAARRLAKDPAQFHFPDLEPPYVREMRLRRTGEEPARTLRGEHPTSVIALLNGETAE